MFINDKVKTNFFLIYPLKRGIGFIIFYRYIVIASPIRYRSSLVPRNDKTAK
jgi:hypothetical protein